jgi:hypothetical protein
MPDQPPPAQPPPGPLWARALAPGRFVLSAACAAAAIVLLVRDPWMGATFATLFVALLLPLVPRYLAHRRVRRVLRSGDVHSVLGAWSGNLSRLPYPETMGPLITAAAFASCGWVDEARTALTRAVRGPAWDAALEHRLFVETLLDAFEGDREAALTKAAKLSSLPLPLALASSNVRVIRNGLAAFARAFAHVSRRGDLALLEHASEKSPLVHWAMRYAAAVVAIDLGRTDRAKKLLAKAPTWPEGSAFHAFHSELAPMLGLAGAASDKAPAARA